MTITKKTLTAAAIAVGLAGAGCDVEQTEEGRAPSIDIQADEGEAPEYDVETAEVEVGTEVQQVETPDIDVRMPGDEESEGKEE